MNSIPVETTITDKPETPVSSMRLLGDKELMDWLDKNVEHLNSRQGAPAATSISVMLNGGHFTAREAITLCITEAIDLMPDHAAKTA